MHPSAKPPQSPPKAYFQKQADLPVVENVSCVFPQTSRMGGLYIGNFMGAQNVELLKQRGIRAVLTTSVQTPIVYPPQHIPFHKRIEAHDRHNFSILDFFEDCLDFIDRHRKLTNVYVHCFAGVSRSASIVIAYIMKCHKWTYDTALNFLKHKRIVVQPNEGFATQLKEYEKRIGTASRATSSASSNISNVSGSNNSHHYPPQAKSTRKQGLPPVPQSAPSAAITPMRPPLPRIPTPTAIKPQSQAQDVTPKKSAQQPGIRSVSNQGSHNFQLQFKHIPSRTNIPNSSNLSLSNVGNKQNIEIHAPLETPVERKILAHDDSKNLKIKKQLKVLQAGSLNEIAKTPTKTLSNTSNTPQKQSPEDDDRVQNQKKTVRPRDLPGYRLN